MKLIQLVLLSLLFAGRVFAQDCDATVADQAQVLNHNDQVEAFAHKLIDQGADVRIRTVGLTPNLDIDEKNFERSCVSWQSPGGGRKSTLLVLMVSPESRKMGIYYGAAFDHALASHWQRIKSDYMAPHFKTKDWAGGFVAAEQQLAARIAASKDEALHPAVSTTVNEATDLSGLWKVFGWLLGLGAFGFLVWLFFSWWGRMKKEHEELDEAQRRAIATKSRAVNLLDATRRNSPDSPWLERALAKFNLLSNQVKNDPNDETLALEDYKVIETQYQEVVDILEEPYVRGGRYQAMAEQTAKEKVKTRKAHSSMSAEDAASTVGTTSTVGGFPVPIPVPIVEPIFIPEPVREREPEPEPERRSRRHDDDSSSSSSDSGGSSDFGGGGDSGGGGGSSDF